MFSSPKFICTCSVPGVDERVYFDGERERGKFSDVEGFDGKFTVHDLIHELRQFYEERIRKVWVPIQISLLRQKISQLTVGSAETEEVQGSIAILKERYHCDSLQRQLSTSSSASNSHTVWKVNSPLRRITIMKHLSKDGDISINEGQNIYELCLMDDEDRELVAALFPLDVIPCHASVTSMDGVEVSFLPVRLNEDKTRYMIEITLGIREEVKLAISSRGAFPDVSIDISLYGEHVFTQKFQIKIPRKTIQDCHGLLAEITSAIPYPLDPAWPDLYIPKVVIAGDKESGKSSLLKRLVGIEDLFSPELLGDLSGCVQLHVRLRRKCTDKEWSIVNNSTGEREFTRSNFREVMDVFEELRGDHMVIEDRILVHTVPSRIDLDIIEMSRVARKGYSVSNTAMEKLIHFSESGQNAYFICVCPLELPVGKSPIWNLIEVENGQHVNKRVSRIVLNYFISHNPVSTL